MIKAMHEDVIMNTILIGGTMLRVQSTLYSRAAGWFCPFVFHCN